MDASPLSPDEIRNQTARLHALARRLAVAVPDADEAIQQTWLQSLRSGLPGPRALPAFLATTLRNVIAFSGRTQRRRAVRSAADGSFAIDGASVGDVRLVVRHPEWPIRFDGPLATSLGAEVARTIAMRAGATIRGTALDTHGNVVPDATIALADEVVEGMRVLGASVRTDRNGRFELRRLVATQYLLYGSGRGSDGEFAVWTRHVDVAADQVVDVDLVPAGAGAIEVEIAGDGGAVQEVFVSVALRNASSFTNPPFHATASGRAFVVRGLPAGDFDVRVSGTDPSPGWAGATTVTVAGNDVQRVRVQVEPMRR